MSYIPGTNLKKRKEKKVMALTSYHAHVGRSGHSDIKATKGLFTT